MVTQHFDKNEILCDIDVFAEQSIFNLTYTINYIHTQVGPDATRVHLLIQSKNLSIMTNTSRKSITEARVKHCYSLNIQEASLNYGFANLYQFTFENDEIVEYQKTNMTSSLEKSFIQINIGDILITEGKEDRWIYFMRSPTQKKGELEVHYYMRVTQNCQKDMQLEDYGLLYLGHEHRAELVSHRYNETYYVRVGDHRIFNLAPEPVVLDVWWPQTMYLVIKANNIQCSEQVHYRIVSIQTNSALSFENCSFKVDSSFKFD